MNRARTGITLPRTCLGGVASERPLHERTELGDVKNLMGEILSWQIEDDVL
jgi:hypothetical protein